MLTDDLMARLDASGGLLSEDDVCSRFGLFSSELKMFVRAGLVLVLQVGAERRYPAFQFANGGLNPAFSRALRKLPIPPDDPLERIRWWLTPDGDTAPCERLLSGDPVIA